MLSLCCLRSSSIALASAVPWHRRVNRQEPLDLATLWLVASSWMPVYSWLVHDPVESFSPPIWNGFTFAWLQRTRTIPCPATIP